MVRHPFLCIVLVLSFATSSIANSGTLDELRSLAVSGKFTEAFSLAKDMSGTHAGQVDFDFLYGKVARKAGHPEIAVFALERVILKNPSDVNALYERGLALLDIKDLISARKTFKRVLELEPSDPIQSNVVQLLELTDKSHLAKEKSHEVWLDSRFDVGFNSNTNGGSTDLIEFPIQGPQVPDGFANLNASILFERYLSKHDAFFVSFATDNRKNFRSSNWDYNLLGGRMGVEFLMGRFELRIPFETDLLFVNYNFERLMATFAVHGTYKWNALNRTTLIVKARPKIYQSANDDHFSLPIALRHEYGHHLDSMHLLAEVGYARGFAYTNTPGPKVNSYFHARVDFVYEFAKSHFLIPTVRFFSWEFPTSSNPVGPRRDQTLEADLGYEWRFSPNLSLVPMFLLFYNSSTDTNQNYWRYEAQVGLRVQL